MTFKRYTEQADPNTILKKVRVEKFRMSQDNFAKIIGRAQSTIARWETQKSYTRASDIGKMRSYARENELRIPDRLFFDLIDECER